MKNEINVTSYDELIKYFGNNIIEFLINLLTGKIQEALFDSVKIGKGIVDIPNYRMWNNFCNFLYAGRLIDDEQKVNYELLRRLSAILEEGGNEVENAKRILFVVSDTECDVAARYIGRLTNALINEKIRFRQYFRCLKTISNIIVEDIEFLAQKMEKNDYDFSLNDEATIEFVNNGLLIQTEGKLVPTNLAYDLVNCGIRWGHSDLKKPAILPGIELIDSSSIIYADDPVLEGMKWQEF